MRRIGTITQSLLAQRFVGYLHQQSIDAVTRRADSAAADSHSNFSGSPIEGWDIWVHDEDQVENCRQALERFTNDPENDEFHTVTNPPDTEQLSHAWAEPSHLPKSSSHPPPAGGAASSRIGETANASDAINRPSLSPVEAAGRQSSKPVVFCAIFLSVIASLTTGFAHPRPHFATGDPTIETHVFDTMTLVQANHFATSGDPYASIKRGQVWRLWTPMFLHGNELHLTFNVLWLFFLGVAIERLHGSLFLIALLLVSQLVATVLQVEMSAIDWLPRDLRGSPHCIGISGAVYGLFGFLWVRPMVDHRYPLQLDPINIVVMLGSLVLCMTPLIPNVANGAHLGGLLMGIVVGLAKFIGRDFGTPQTNQ